MLCILQALSNKGARPITIQDIDCDAQAIPTSYQLYRKLGHSKTCMDFCCADVKSEGFDLYGFDVVYLAALVGPNNGEKQDVIATLRSA